MANTPNAQWEGSELDADDTKNSAMKHLADELSSVFPGLSMKVKPGVIEITPTREASPSKNGRCFEHLTPAV